MSNDEKFGQFGQSGLSYAPSPQQPPGHLSAPESLSVYKDWTAENGKQFSQQPALMLPFFRTDRTALQEGAAREMEEVHSPSNENSVIGPLLAGDAIH